TPTPRRSSSARAAREDRYRIPFPCRSFEEGEEVDECRTENDDEHRREDEEHRREQHLDRRLHRPLLSRGLTLEPRVRGLHAQDAPERDSELIRLDDRPDERRELGCADALLHLLQGVRSTF